MHQRALVLISWIFLTLSSVPLTAIAAGESLMPDPYAEPGLNPFRDQVSANANEFIDPFSGALHLSHVDLFIPGNGGLDIKIQRNYNSNNVYQAGGLAPSLTQHVARTPTGLGWTLHFGRVVKTGGSIAPNVCDTNVTDPNDDTLDNPVLELPDGSQQTLFVNATSYGQPSTIFITKEQWVASCITGGLLVISPEGVKYTMNYRRSAPAPNSNEIWHYAWYTTRIEDRNGNWMNISYIDTTSTISGKEPVFSGITTSDSRTVSFTYLEPTTSRIRLSAISANGQTWTYGYTLITDSTGDYYQLVSVTGPENFRWQYQYHAKPTVTTAGHRVLRQITYPYGATVTYDYDYVCFNAPDNQCPGGHQSFFSLVVKSKVNGGRGVTAGTWTYTYSPSTVEDVTTVTFPGGKYVYRHFGSRLMFGLGTVAPKNLWRMGLIKEKETHNGTSLINREIYTWEPLYMLSSEKYIRPPYDPDVYFDNDVFAPVLTKKQIVRDGTTYTTTYSNFDASFNPQTITETGQATRTTNLTYFPRATGQNIVRLVKDETLAGELSGKSIFRTFDSNGNLTQITRRGVVENYTYHPTGDLASRTNARLNRWTYSDYHRGIPRLEQHPEGLTVQRTVNPTGTIASETNRRGFTTSYTYDGMNRVRSISRPLGAPINVTWNVSLSTTTGRTVTRGIYTQTITFDGFGRPSLIDANGITRDIRYDALGHKSFESYLSSTTGDSYTTDVLGRVTRVTHGDGAFQTLSYLSGNQVRITNERSHATTYTYRSFGDPDRAADRVLMRIDAPELVSTVFARNILGQVTSVTQGGVTRSYAYSNSDNFLISVANPETGTTTFGRDAVGNMISRQVGSSGITNFTYDGLDRLTGIDYPVGTNDVTIQYDGNDNVTVVDNGTSRRTLGYDNNDNLKSETISIGTLSFTAAYAYNNLDYLSTITYPSLRQISYSPDALGRPTTVLPHVTSVGYHPNGVPQTIAYANGQTAALGLNDRQWVSSIIANNGTVFASHLSYSYDGAGNVAGIINGLDNADSKSMAYDGLDRLVTAGVASVSYDPTGNITSMRTSAGDLSYGYDGIRNRLSSVSGLRSYSFSYDVYGNVSGNGQQSFSYDDAGNLRAVAGVATYDYDGKNLRVRAQKGGATTHFFYGQGGTLLGEYDSTGTTKEYVYLGGKLVATVESVPDPAPSVPSSITVPASDFDGTYDIAWGSSTGTVTRYELEEATDSAFATATNVSSGTALSVTLTGRGSGTYYYRVRACNGTSCSGYLAGSNGVVVDVNTPGIPSSITVPANDSDGSYVISWGGSSGTVTRYELEEATAANFAGAVQVYSGLNLSVALSGKGNGTYYYRVRACNNAGCSGYREGTNGVTVTVPSAPPGTPPFINVPSESEPGVPYTISWGASSGIVSYYELQEAVPPFGRSLPPGDSTSLSYKTVWTGSALAVTFVKTTPPFSNAWYYYRVRACNIRGCSAYRIGMTPIKITGTGRG